MRHDRDPRLDEAKLIPMERVIARLGITGLKRVGREMVGPCPLCGGRDRFAVNLDTRAFLCRRCEIKGNDQLALVMAIQRLPFVQKVVTGDPPRTVYETPALDWLVGPGVVTRDPAEVERLRRETEAREAAEQAKARKFRERAIQRGRGFWEAAGPPSHPVLRAYLEARGLPGDILDRLAPDALRLHPDLPYVRRIGTEVVTLHRGPAMIGRIMGAARGFLGAHCTWIDPERPGRKAQITQRIADNKGDPWDPKLVHGSQKGGAICLTFNRSETLIMGEGIETTLTALAADAVPGADYWSGLNLDNMAGRRLRVPGKRHSDQPDLADADAFVPPPWVRRLVYIMDGDSDPVATRARLQAGLIRAMEMVPGLRGQIVAAPEGQDLNDMVKGGAA